ncbi:MULTISPECIES: DUF1330 domain-containing protein [unclassified Streptomyces]|uniref:DUF1330 domain-containing protein n=1 Tax=unclassified Streptomyces TaxID=2593676 RepID=UPI002DDAE619|nr:DUF1330 domain-containing protein [Streptomyces sp. NBC_01750]WSA97987.1 DUF1330 domain-containing protein [Streptomyces sp. NBC_01794]WSD37460.1 DUF1330 domain-containing protein [Streptomyces sp. NBC_01750]
MTALLIGNVGIIGDLERMAEYRAKVLRTLELYGGGFMIRGGEFEVLEGDWKPTHMSVMAFPTADQARQWYASPEYRAIVPLRDGTHMDLVLVEGE